VQLFKRKKECRYISLAKGEHEPTNRVRLSGSAVGLVVVLGHIMVSPRIVDPKQSHHCILNALEEWVLSSRIVYDIVDADNSHVSQCRAQYASKAVWGSTSTARDADRR
jgi:hypothetical protein